MTASTIITTNLDYDSWYAFLGQKKMVAALLDRLRHRCHSPTYRKLGEFESFGLRLPESTARDGYSRPDIYLAGLHPLIRSDLVASHLVSVDDTRIITLDPEASGNKFTSRMWTFIGDQNRVIYFDVTKTWKASDFADLLPEFHAKVLQGDGYAGYSSFLEPWLNVIQAGCLDHYLDLHIISRNYIHSTFSPPHRVL